MPLSKILLDIATETGIAVTNDNEKAWVIDKINDIAEEMYATQDITGCLREMTINIDADDDGPVYSSLVALPYYVDQLRGLRFSVILGGKIPMETMQPRYSLGHGWQNNPYSLPFRIVRDNAPLKRDISNASVLTFTIAEPQAEDIVLNVVGKTTNASRAQETVTLVAGDITVSTVGNFEDVESISKNAVCGVDITVEDVDGNTLAEIPNSEIRPLYKWLELRDANASFGTATPILTQSAIDILYKMRFTPFANLQDEFPCGSKCDRAIFYRFMAYYEAMKQGNEGRAAAMLQKSDELLRNLNTDNEVGKQLELQFGRDGRLDAQIPYTWNSWGASYGNGSTSY